MPGWTNSVGVGSWSLPLPAHVVPYACSDVFLVVHVAAGDPPLVGRLEVHAQQIFTALGDWSGILAGEVEAAAARRSSVREDAQATLSPGP